MIKKISRYKNDYNNYEKKNREISWEKKEGVWGHWLTVFVKSQILVTVSANLLCILKVPCIIYIFNPFPPWQLFETWVGYVWAPLFGRRRLGAAVWAIWAPRLSGARTRRRTIAGFFLVSFFCSYVVSVLFYCFYSIIQKL